MFDDDETTAMTLEEATRIQELMDAYDDLPDGAFFAVLEENGIYPEDIEAAQVYLEAQGL